MGIKFSKCFDHTGVDRSFSMFWHTNKRSIKDQFASQIKIFLSIATMQNIGIILSAGMGKYDPRKNIHQKLLTYMYYDVLASAFVGASSQEERDCVGFLRDTSLSGLDEKDMPQFRTYHADNIKDVSSLNPVPLEVLQLLDLHDVFTQKAASEIGNLSIKYLDALRQKDLDSVRFQLKDLVEDEMFFHLFNGVAPNKPQRANKIEHVVKSKSDQETGPWGKVVEKEEKAPPDMRENLLEQIIEKQIEHITERVKLLDEGELIRFQVIVHYYCSFLISAFLQIKDPEIVQVRARAYSERLTGMPAITIASFEDYIKENPVFSNSVNQFISEEVKRILLDEFTASDVPTHLLNVINQHISTKCDNVLITCPYCGTTEDFADINVKDKSQIYTNDDFYKNESGLQIYSFLCFQCRRVTDFAPDANNDSGLAEGGIEYFKTKLLNLDLLIAFYKNAKKHSNEIAIKKMEKLLHQ